MQLNYSEKILLYVNFEKHQAGSRQHVTQCHCPPTGARSFWVLHPVPLEVWGFPDWQVETGTVPSPMWVPGTLPGPVLLLGTDPSNPPRQFFYWPQAVFLTCLHQAALSRHPQLSPPPWEHWHFGLCRLSAPSPRLKDSAKLCPGSSLWHHGLGTHSHHTSHLVCLQCCLLPDVQCLEKQFQIFVWISGCLWQKSKSAPFHLRQWSQSFLHTQNKLVTRSQPLSLNLFNVNYETVNIKLYDPSIARLGI